VRARCLAQVGELMRYTHAGYTAIGLGAPETDAMVERLRALGPAAGIYGARVSGGGSGGTVAVLCEAAAVPTVAALAADPDVMARTGHLWSSWQLERDYGFTDADGRRPRMLVAKLGQDGHFFGQLFRSETANCLPFNFHKPAFRRQYTADQFQHGRFPAAIRP
jgi:hypothetical protein